MASEAYERRNARARALGYRNYYDYRIHGYGREPPGAPVDPEARAERMGLRRGGGFLALLRNPDRVGAITELRTSREAIMIVTMRTGEMRVYRVPFRRLPDILDLVDGSGIPFRGYGRRRPGEDDEDEQDLEAVDVEELSEE